MKILDQDIQNALKNDPELSKLVGVKVFRNAIPVKFQDDLPHIRVAEGNNIDSDYADDEATDSYITMQVDVWDRNTDEILPLVHSVMKSLGFKRLSVVTEYNQDKNEVRKIMRYGANIEI